MNRKLHTGELKEIYYIQCLSKVVIHPGFGDEFIVVHDVYPME